MGSYSYDRRAAAKPKFEVEHSSGQVWVGLATKDEDVGYIILGKLGGHGLKAECQANVDALKAEVGDKPVLRVVDVQIEDEWLGKGWGTKLYARALREASPALVVTGGCTGMGTTSSAFRVWKSLAKRYPSQGSGPNDLVISV